LSEAPGQRQDLTEVGACSGHRHQGLEVLRHQIARLTEGDDRPAAIARGLGQHSVRFTLVPSAE